MKYSIGGNIFTSDGADIVNIINDYKLWKLTITNSKDNVTSLDVFDFELWVNNELDKNNLFDDLKPLVDVNGGYINWHECSHDEEVFKPCVIVEEYKGG